MTPPSHYFGYARVSTVKQGEHGVSLEAQRDAILAYAQRERLEVVRWFEERVTAAKEGRPLFTQMVRLLRRGTAAGVIVHKIDRSARNFHDWALLGDLIDEGIDVRFAHEPVDLRTRGGRLAADMMAVVAADFIRNQREETKKGLFGRLKQGLYPFRAPLGYLDQGGGRPKVPEPGRGALIARAFTLYDQGQLPLRLLQAEMTRRGLRSRGGTPVTVSALAEILRNPFYAGLIKIKTSGETYQGAHEPLIPMRLFERVQARLDGRLNRRPVLHDYPFRRLLPCAHCRMSLIGETQKGRVYYRCHTPGCPTTSVREDVVEAQVRQLCESVTLQADDLAYLRMRADHLREHWAREKANLAAAQRLARERLTERLARLTDAYVDRLIDRQTFVDRKEGLLREQRRLEEESGSQTGPQMADRLTSYLELARAPWKLYQVAEPAHRRLLLEVLTSNWSVSGRKLALMPAQPFAAVARFNTLREGGHYQNKHRTRALLFAELVPFCGRDEQAELVHQKAQAVLLDLAQDTADPLEAASA